MKAIELDETFAEGYWVAGDIYAWLLRAPDKALASYDRALALNPNHDDWYNGGLINAYFQARQFDQAILAFESIAPLDWQPFAAGGQLCVSGSFR